MATSLSALLAHPLPSQREQPRGYVIKYWRGTREIFDVTTPDGILMLGCRIHGSGASRRVRTTGFHFASTADKRRFSDAVLAAIDASDGANHEKSGLHTPYHLPP